MPSHWHPYKPSATQPWNMQRVWHLHRRAGFGATWHELERDVADGPEQSIQRVLDGTSRSYAQREDFASISHVIAEAAAGSDDEDRLKAAWLFRMLFTPHPLVEKLTLMWHNHFATSNLKVNNLALMWRQNEWLRQHALGSFKEMLTGIIRDPAMLLWLDANTNRVGHPNENLARELMELFTLGVGNYSEADVQAAARALTGWSVVSGEPRFRTEHYDADHKTILGKEANFDADSLVELLLKQPATCRRIAWRLCDAFMGEGVVGPAAISELADQLESHQLNIGHAVSTLLRSELFFSAANLKSRVSSPVEHIVSTVRSLEMLDAPPSTLILAQWAKRMGQDLFRPPNVGGWPGGRHWLNTRNIVARAKFAEALVAGQLRSPIARTEFQVTSAEHLSQLCLGVPALDGNASLALLLSSPQAFLD